MCDASLARARLAREVDDRATTVASRGHCGQETPTIPAIDWRRVWYPASLAAILLAHLAWLARFPALHVDEGQNVNWLLAWWHGTWATTSIDRLAYPSPFYIGGPFGLSAIASLETFGVGLFQARLSSLMWGVALLGATYWLGRQLYGAREARAATLLVALSYPFLLSTHVLRVDVVVAALGLASVSCMLLGRSRAWLNVAAGLLLPVAADIHLNAAAYGLGIALMLLATYRFSIWRRKEAWLFALGIAIGALLTVGLLPSGMAEARLGAVAETTAGSKQPPIFAMSLPQALVGEVVLQMSNLFWSGLVDALLLLCTLVWTVGHRAREDRPMLWLWLGMFAHYALFSRSKSAFYLVEWYPIVALLLASTLRQVALQTGRVPWERIYAALVGIACLALLTNRTVSQLVPSRHYDSVQLSNTLRDAIPPGATVLGEPQYWLELQDHPYVNWWVVSVLWRRDGQRPRASIEAIKPDAIIVDRGVRTFFWKAENDPSSLLNSPFWRPIAEPLMVNAPIPGTLEEVLGDDYRLAAESERMDGSHVQIYVHTTGS